MIMRKIGMNNNDLKELSLPELYLRFCLAEG